VKLAAKIFGGLSGLFLLFLVLGILLPGTWEARTSALILSPPASVFPLLDNLEAWSSWSPMPEAGSETFGNTHGVGAGLRWSDPQYGKGEMLITSSTLDSEVQYRVEIEGGALTILGRLSLTPEKGGTRIHWEEEGDFGWNPLMGYAAKGMAESQGEALQESLRALARLFSKPEEAREDLP
jgi:hypothetical protein